MHFNMLPLRKFRCHCLAVDDLQRDEVPDPNSYQLIEQVLKERLITADSKSVDRVTEADDYYYRTVSRLIWKVDRSLDRQTLDQRQLGKDKALFSHQL